MQLFSAAPDSSKRPTNLAQVGSPANCLAKEHLRLELVAAAAAAVAKEALTREVGWLLLLDFELSSHSCCMQ